MLDQPEKCCLLSYIITRTRRCQVCFPEHSPGTQPLLENLTGELLDGLLLFLGDLAQSQEVLLVHLDYVPVRTLYGNQTYLLAGLFAYNLTRELQMQTVQPARGTTAKRTCLWVFGKVDTLRKTLLHRAGRLSRPQGILTLMLSANSWIRTRLLQVLDQIPTNA
jgi:hypothetical protein